LVFAPFAGATEVPMAGLVIDWLALETAFESHDPTHRVWLDTAIGDLHMADAPAATSWLRVEAIPSREQYRMMERFIATVINSSLKDALQDAIVGKGAFRRFKDALGRFPDERKRWFAFRDALLHRFILDWLKANRLELQEIPAWNLDPPMTPSPEPLVASEASGPLPVFSTASLLSPSLSPSSPSLTPSSAPLPERTDIDHLRAYLQAWARAHGEEYRYLFGPAAFDRLASDLTHEFQVHKKPRSMP
jgi:hypothetical protein